MFEQLRAFRIRSACGAAALAVFAAPRGTEQLSAQTVDPALVAPYPECASCVEWNRPMRPLHIFGNTYWVGTEGLGAILIASPDGHILIDGGLPDSAPRILASIRALGFDPADVDLLLNSHVHYDHAGGLAALESVTGAVVAASRPSAAVLQRGRPGPDDPQHEIAHPIPPVREVSAFDNGDTLRVGGIEVRALLTPGHTAGGTSWTWRSCEGDRCLDFVYADSLTPVSADGYRFSDHPEVVAGFQHAFAALESAACDVVITPHPSASQFFERFRGGIETLVAADGCRRYVATARERLAARLERERTGR